MHPLLSEQFNNQRGRDEHERRIRAHFGERLAAATGSLGELDAVETTFIIFTNRSGSNLLVDLLRASGRFGGGGEPLNWDQAIASSSERRDPSFAHYLAAQLTLAADGRLVMKASLQQYDFLHRSGLLQAVFRRRRILLTQRLDKIAQSVSWLIARQTLAWNSTLPAERPLEAVRYDRGAIQDFAAAAMTQERDAEIYFTLRGEVFARVVYEELLEDRDGALARLARVLDCGELRVEPRRLSLRRQATALNAALKQRFLSESLPEREHPS